MGPSGRLSDGGAELCGGAFAARQENGARPATAAAEIARAILITSYKRQAAGELSGGGRGKRLAGVGANALDHGAQAVGALRRQMFAKSEFVENRNCIGCKNLPRRVAG